MKFVERVQTIKSKPNDKIYTPLRMALTMIHMCDITPEMRVLDCCKGGGIFYDNLPECQKDWCEIDDGKDFYDCHEKYDLIIGNPPYSQWDRWIEHTMKLTDKFCYVFGTFNLTERRMGNILEKGYGITKLHIMKVDWWFSPSFIAVFERNKPTILTADSKRVMCDECGKRCHRGIKGHNPNVCGGNRNEK
jgi:hypothetical protein